MNSWDDFRFLLAVHKSGTMTAAAKNLNTNVATVSRRIERAAESLGYPPFIRTATGWEPNRKLAGILDTVESFDAALSREMSRLATAGEEQVTLRIGAPPVVCSQVLYPSLGHAMPTLKSVRLSFHDRFHGEGLGDYDIVIQASRPETGRLVTRRIGRLTVAVFGRCTKDIGSDWIALTPEFDAYPAMQLGFTLFGTEPTIRADLFEHVLEISQATGLPAPMPEILARNDPRLRRIGPLEHEHQTEFWVMYHSSRQGDPAVRAVIDWMESSFSLV